MCDFPFLFKEDELCFKIFHKTLNLILIFFIFAHIY